MKIKRKEKSDYRSRDLILIHLSSVGIWRRSADWKHPLMWVNRARVTAVARHRIETFLRDLLSSTFPLRSTSMNIDKMKASNSDDSIAETHKWAASQRVTLGWLCSLKRIEGKNSLLRTHHRVKSEKRVYVNLPGVLASHDHRLEQNQERDRRCVYSLSNWLHFLIVSWSTFEDQYKTIFVFSDDRLVTFSLKLNDCRMLFSVGVLRKCSSENEEEHPVEYPIRCSRLRLLVFSLLFMGNWDLTYWWESVISNGFHQNILVVTSARVNVDEVWRGENHLLVTCEQTNERRKERGMLLLL